MDSLRQAAATLLLVAGLLPAGACDGARPERGGPAPARPATLVVAVDGLDWNLLLPAMRAGRTPHLLDLARRGSAARLTTFEPTDSPIIWTSVATGKVKEKHGITAFAERSGGRLVPVTSNQRLARAFWGILGESGVPVGIVGWWVTWPAEPVEGWMVAPVSSLAGRTWKGSVYGDIPDQTWPPGLLEELRPLLNQVEAGAPALLARLLPAPAEAPDWVGELRRDVGWSVTSDALFAAAGEHVARRHRPRVLAVYQGALDVAGHRFWGYTVRPEGAPTPHGLPEATAATLAGYLPALLEQTDATIGRLRAAMPPDTDVIVLSDHGMHERRAEGPGEPWRSPLLAYNTGAHGDAPDGVWIAAGPSFRAPKPPFQPPASAGALPRLGSPEQPGVLDLTPTLLHLHGLPVGEDMDGSVLGGLLVEDAASRPVRRVATWEKGPPPSVRPQPISAATDAEVIERLRSLGYLGDGP